MNEIELEQFITRVSKYGSILGLESIRRLCGQLDDPQEATPVIQIAGTNGKGSVGTFLCSVLKEAGYHVGRFASPAVFSYEEMFQVDGVPIKKSELAKLYTKVSDACEILLAQGYPHPTIFEVETAAAYLYFKEQKCQIAIVEAGMGGETDATNLVSKNVCAVLCAISLDHMAFLGDTLESIATVKSGIIKEHCPVVVGVQPQCVRQIMIDAAQKKDSVITLVEEGEIRRHEFDTTLTKMGQSFSYKDAEDVSIQLLGSYQLENAALAIETVNVLREQGFLIAEDALYEGMAKSVWPGRMERISDSPEIYIDGAHNPGAALKLRQTVEMYFTNRRIVYIIGVLGDKDHERILQEMAPFSDTVYTITPNHVRAYDGHKLAAEAEKYYTNVRAMDSVKAAYEAATEECRAEDDLILAFGSLSFLKELKNAQNSRCEDK